jgi:hypothetical protein
MKKRLLLFAALVTFSSAHSFSQCMPDVSITVPGVYPDTVVNLDTATEAQPYSDTLQFRVYSTVPPATVDSVRILSVNGMPSGFTYSTNPAGNVFPGGSNGCILIQGTPPAAGTYPLNVMLRFFGNISSFPVQIDTPLTGYKIIVLPASGINDPSAMVFNVLQNKPNPFEAATQIEYTVPTAGKVDFKLIDLLGKEIITRKVDAVAGANNIQLNSKYIRAGIYFYSVTYKSKTITRKMIVSTRP